MGKVYLLSVTYNQITMEGRGRNMMFLSRSLIALLTVTSFISNANALSDLWDSPDAIPAVITKVEVHVYNMHLDGGNCVDKYNECYRADIFLNGQQVARWAASPGRPHYGTKFVGVFTPIFEGRSFHPNHLHQYYTNRFGDSMPWAAFIKTSDGAKSGIATHCGNVTGRRESHGCIRLDCTRQNNAKLLNLWIREAFANGGTAKIWTEHTREPLWGRGSAKKVAKKKPAFEVSNLGAGLY